MSEITDKMNWLLSEIDNKRWISLSKDDSVQTFKAKDKLEAYNLIERQGENSWRLTKEGYHAVELGGFEEWLTKINSKEITLRTEQHLNGENISIVNGNKNIVGQSIKKLESSERESLTKEIIVGVVISVLSGVILIFMSNFWNNDGDSENYEESNYKYTDTPISLTFKDGSIGVLLYSASVELIDSLFIESNSTFENPDKAINYLKARIRNELIVTLEKAELDSVRTHRRKIAKEIIQITERDQIYSGYRIISLNIDEIRNVANGF